VWGCAIGLRCAADFGVGLSPSDFRELRYLVHKEIRRHEFVVTSCTGKQKYATHGAASQAIHPHKRGLVNAYRCKVCSGWHVGTRTPHLHRRAA
jgi:hypothetical protein